MAVRIWTGKDTEADKGDEFYDVSWEGRVVSLREYNGYDDSDFYAEVWDDATSPAEGLREVWYATTRGWTYYNSASVDATPEVLAAFEAYRARRYAQALADSAAAEAEMPKLGRRVRVFKGRKVPVGTEGTVIWYGEGRYGWRVGLKDAGGTVQFTAAGNVEVVVPAGTN